MSKTQLGDSFFNPCLIIPSSSFSPFLLNIFPWAVEQKKSKNGREELPTDRTEKQVQSETGSVDIEKLRCYAGQMVLGVKGLREVESFRT